MLILAVLNWLIFRAVTSARARHVTLVSTSNSSSHRRDNTMSTLLTSIVLIFVTCHTPKANVEDGWKIYFLRFLARVANGIFRNDLRIFVILRGSDFVLYMLKDTHPLSTHP